MLGSFRRLKRLGNNSRKPPGNRRSVAESDGNRRDMKIATKKIYGPLSEFSPFGESSAKVPKLRRHTRGPKTLHFTDDTRGYES